MILTIISLLADYTHYFSKERLGGGYIGVVSPDLIPNTEVKCSGADASALRESR